MPYSLAEAATAILRAAEPQKSPHVRPARHPRRLAEATTAFGINCSTILRAIKQGAMRNLDTPKAVIIAALIVSATIMFTFRYSFSEARGGLLFNRLTGTLMPCSNIYADCQILHARFVESETPPPASEPPAQNQKPGFPEFEPVNPEQFPGLPEGFEPVKYSLYQPASRPRRVRPTGP